MGNGRLCRGQGRGTYGDALCLARGLFALLPETALATHQGSGSRLKAVSQLEFVPSLWNLVGGLMLPPEWRDLEFRRRSSLDSPCAAVMEFRGLV